jgi:hypothetical protein
MSTPDSQKRVKEEAKALAGRIEALIKDADPKERMIRTVCVYAGLLTETLVEYEEPDIVMEQAFARIADLLRADPAEMIDEGDLLPLAWTLDHDTELGRHLARGIAKRLPRGMDDVHEIAIALVINDFPERAKQGFGKDVMLRLLVEMVIDSLTFEMATQDFCDLLVEEFIADGDSPAQAVTALAAIAGSYFQEAKELYVLPPDAEQRLTEVMVRESRRHGTPGSRNWEGLAVANDGAPDHLYNYMAKLKPEVQEFFELVGLEDPLACAVSAAKAAGRMVAVITVEDVGQIHPSIAKSLAKTGMILGSKYKEAGKSLT